MGKSDAGKAFACGKVIQQLRVGCRCLRLGEVPQDQDGRLVLRPAEPRRCVSAGNELRELALLRNSQGRSQQARIGQAIECDALNSLLINEFSAWHQHLIDEGLDVRKCRTC